MKSHACVAAFAVLCACLYLPAAEALTCWVGTGTAGLGGQGLTQQTCTGPACKVYGNSATGQYISQCGESGISGTVAQCTAVLNWQTNPSPCYCYNNLCNPATRSVPVSIGAVLGVAVATALAAVKWH